MSFIECALAEIRKHPEIFVALEEFEKTGRIPKFTPEFIEKARCIYKKQS